MKPIEILDEILGNAIKVKILRNLAVGYEAKTGRALAKIASVSQPAALKPLQELVDQGILIKTIIGKSHCYNLNKKNILVTEGLHPLFQLETNLLQTFAEILKKSLPVKVNSAILYGSVARGSATHQSDWDVLLVCPDDETAKKILTTLPKVVIELTALFSSNIDIKVMTTESLQNKFISGESLALNIYEDFINSKVQNPLFGNSLTELLRKNDG
jgi:predicted nucleotidyltransferase